MGRVTHELNLYFFTFFLAFFTANGPLFIWSLDYLQPWFYVIYIFGKCSFYNTFIIYFAIKYVSIDP